MDAPDVPDRIIRDRARSSPTLQALSDAAERAWWRLTTACDDYGRFDADAEVLLAELFKRRPKGWSVRRMAGVLAEWEGTQLIHRYANGDETREYGHVLTWGEHQRERDSKPKYPDPPCGGLPQAAAKCGESRLARARSESRESLTTESREARAERREAGDWPHPAALVALWNAKAPDECATVESLSVLRRRKAREFLATFPEQAWWEETMAQLHRSKFLRGQVKPLPGHSKPFVASFDWLLANGKEGVENAVQVHDGKYRDG